MKLTVEAAEAGQRLDRFLADRLPDTSRALIMKYLKEGHALVDGRRTRPGESVRAGVAIELPDFEQHLERIRGGRATGLPAVPRIKVFPDEIQQIFEDEHLVVVSKPAGLVMHPGEGHEDEGLDGILREHFGPSTRLVHRLDRDTSGVVVAARGHPRSARRLGEAFREGDVQKEYVALVRGVPDPAQGVVDAPLLDTKEPGTKVRVDAGGKSARTGYEIESAFERYAWLRLRPATGRRHQVRVHLAHLGHPLVVDPLYAQKKRLRLRELRPDLPPSWQNPVVLTRTPLHAESLTFRHPHTGEEVRFGAPLPDDLQQVLELLGES